MSEELKASVGILDLATGKSLSFADFIGREPPTELPTVETALRADIGIQRECKLRSRSGNDTSLGDEPFQDKTLCIEGCVSVLPHRFNFALKAVNACKRLGKLLLQQFNCGHGTKPVIARSEGGKP